MTSYILDLTEISPADVALAGGKGANLGELSRIDGVRGLPGFCVTTEAFQRVIADTPVIGALLDRLSEASTADLAEIAADLRRAIQTVSMPVDLVTAITRQLTWAPAKTDTHTTSAPAGDHHARTQTDTHTTSAESGEQHVHTQPDVHTTSAQASDHHAVTQTDTHTTSAQGGQQHFSTQADTHSAFGRGDDRRATTEMDSHSSSGWSGGSDAFDGVDAEAAYAVRSSATAEDMPTASFAGQHDTYLNVPAREVHDHIRRCWASLFTDRAVSYRRHNKVDHRRVHMAVVVQRMAYPLASGILFTADPVTSDRAVSTVDAGFGLGEALVSGLVNPDVYRVRDDTVIARTIAAKQLTIRPRPEGGTEERAVDPERQERAALADDEVLTLVRLGRLIESHFGRPQDIEWCRDDDGFVIVQSRPITTLFPVPPINDDEKHVYVSVGHQQMMTDPMKPLGLAFWQMTTPRPMAEAGGRLFVDVTEILARPSSRGNLIDALGTSDPLIGGALRSIVERDGFLPDRPDEGTAWVPPGSGAPILEADPAVVTELIEAAEQSLAVLKRDIEPLTGPALLDFIRADLPVLRAMLQQPRSMQVIMAGMNAAGWLNEHIRDWLGEPNAADTIAQSVPHNVTSEMGLALLDVADAIRPYPEVVVLLERGGIDELPPEPRRAIQDFLDVYGMRCAGEIDITRPRWSERPATLVPLILGNVRNFEPGARERLFEQGRRQALDKERDLLARVQPEHRDETKRMIDRVRTFSGYREYPKYHMIARYFVYKLALLAEADRLVAAGVLDDREDIFFLSFDELADPGRATAFLSERKAAYESYLTVTPPRVFTSDGEVVTGTYGDQDLPPGALAGLPVSAGTVEGRARVVRDMTGADLAPGDILVTAYTDPSWTPAFVTVAGLVTEVGGLMTHGAVIAREYGLPAVVGVEQATRLITDGQRIRVHGTAGYVEILD
ncbi:phosphoenolpyruvate synthase [Actinoplanes sp. TRM 88003]|uniref:Phosphoenolpyruvate synthase n=1 Tax=Paractinoplanes aksuensis TaxID=2939490 RepID=A0ABT1DWI1_9ACTN|nr:rifamycin-inactivating phosphotransferase [Actinoplanes aksuensis]MCO8275183.1 phosphoenolpyruvate synthase [Actinoplanes aksuensis]